MCDRICVSVGSPDEPSNDVVVMGSRRGIAAGFRARSREDNACVVSGDAELNAVLT